MSPTKRGLRPGRLVRRVAIGAAASGMLAYTAGVREMRSQVRRHRAGWERSNLDTLLRLREQPHWNPYVLLALGDSSTQGVGAATRAEGYVPRLAEKLAAVLGRDVATINLSVSGGTAQTVLATQLPQLAGLGIMPDQVVLNFGGNDVGVRELSVQDFEEQADELLDALPEGTLVGNIPSFGFLPADDRAAELSEALVLATVAADHVPVDLRSLTQSFSTPDYLVRYHAGDLFHPNARAYAAWANEFWDAWLYAHPHIEGSNDENN